MKKQIDFTIDEMDLKTLFLHTRHCYKGYTFEKWCDEIKRVYAKYHTQRETPKTFFEWVNGQILAIAY